MKTKLLTPFKQKITRLFVFRHCMPSGILPQLMKKAHVLLCLPIVCMLLQGYEAKAQNAAGYVWKNVAIGGGGFVSAIIPSPTTQNLVYARTDVGGAYRWNASTSSWVPLLDWVSDNEVGFLGVESLAIDPQLPNRVYMLVGISYFNNGKTAILRSDDYGNTFTITDVSTQFKAHGNGMGRQTGEKLVVDPHNSNILYCGTRWNGLFRSTDAGATWSRLSSLNVTTTPNENGISFVLLDGSSVSGGVTQRIFVGVSRSGSTNLYRSDNGGQSFTAVSGATTTFMPHRAALAGNGTLYLTYGNGAGPHAHWSQPEPMDNGQIWKYNISTGAWTNITPSGFNRAFGGISVDPNNPNRIVASTINTYMNQNGAWGDRMFLSTNGGSSWVDVVDRGFTLDPDGITWVSGHAIHWAGSIAFDPFNTERVWVTSGNGIFVNDNISTSGTWRFAVKGLEETVPLGLESIPNGPVVSVIGDYDGFRHTTNVNQYAPIHQPQMGTTTGLAVAAQNTNKIVRVGNSMYYSNDMGISWTQNNMNGTQGQVALSANGNTVLHSPKESSVTYRSTNNGSSWSAVSGLSFNEARPAGDPVNSNKFYAYNPGNGAVMVSTNGGSSFSQAGSVASGGSQIIRLAPGMEGHVWIALNNGGLARSTNSAQSFSTISSVSNCGAVGFGVAAPGTNYPAIYIWGTINNIRGVYRSTDQGASWVRVNDDTHEYGGPGNGQFVQGDMNVFGRVYMSTAGRGIVYGESGSDACTPSAITPYTQLNGGTWQQTANASLAAGGSVRFGPQPVQGGSWNWSGPNNFSAATREIAISNIHSNQAGSYIATYTNSGGCQSTQTFSITLTGAAKVSAAAIVTEDAIGLYPNPANTGRFTVTLPDIPEIVIVTICDNRGSILYEKKTYGSKKIEIESGLKTGVYLVRISSRAFSLTKKLIIR
ncbi:T9SS type A sorting domain-containing protein [Chitinophaga qingshengii]|uniref:T9SS type A sorting domain-containing protein n=1 Tax=Chitinophaga qingshengii TaxID=1569794 RepID=A0ABR7TVB8_9BACT|nr:T9SS type A sorting domain-containing protein [Chitinophaga qingshengii]MBC9934429.1 T9SS type A sorting domain-containing protein [Chitinophaga qingshengii]